MLLRNFDMFKINNLLVKFKDIPSNLNDTDEFKQTIFNLVKFCIEGT